MRWVRCRSNPGVLRYLRHLVTYQLERLLLGGSIYRLLVIGALIGLISMVAGALAYEWDLIQGGEADLAGSVWWAFLRMTDPGYLGDDEGTVKRTISTVVTVCGYVLFMGALIAIMTQWLHATIDRLEQGLTPIIRKRHVVVLGWTDRTPEILRELVGAGTRLRRFLRRVGARKLVIAVLAENVGHHLLVTLRERLGRDFSRAEIILRSGDPLRIEHLRRVDYARAGVVIIPGEEHSSADEADVDARTVKTLLTIGRFARSDGARRLPAVVAALRDPRKVAAARSAYPEAEIATLAVDAVLGRMLAQSLRHPGLSYVLDELLTQTWGSEIYLREFPEFTGRSLGSLATAFADAVVLGVLRGHGEQAEPLLNPGGELVIADGDRLVLLANDYSVTLRPQAPAPEPVAPRAVAPVAMHRRLLLIGWSHLTPDLLFELDQHGEAIAVTLLSSVPPGARQRRLEQAGAAPRHLVVDHIEADASVPRELEAIDLRAFDDVLILGTDRLTSAEDADARTLLIHHLVREVLSGGDRKRRHLGPRVMVELHDPTNADLFEDEETEVLASSEVVSHLLAQMALRHDLGLVFDRLFGPGGAEVAFVPAAEFGVAGSDADFDRLTAFGAARGETVLGLRRAGHDERGGVMLNPSRDRRYALGSEDAVIVLRSVASASAGAASSA